ncbi:unnamed protein product [Choristocarpus tenellus]
MVVRNGSEKTTKFAPCEEEGSLTHSHGSVEEAVVGAAVRGGSLLMLLAFLQRGSTFVLNLLLQREMIAEEQGRGGRAGRSFGLEEYGAACITLELISSTVLFLAREPFRLALARSRVLSLSQGADESMRRRLVNTAWLAAPVGLFSAVLVHTLYPWVIRNDDFIGVKENRQAVTMVCGAAALELMCEPLSLIFQNRLLVSVRVRAEAAAVLVLGVSRFLLVTQAGMGVASFGFAQIMHSATLAAVYLWFVGRETTASRGSGGSSDGDGDFASVQAWLPQNPTIQQTPEESGVETTKGEGWFNQIQVELAKSLTAQSLLKHVLTEGDKIVLAHASGNSSNVVATGPGNGITTDLGARSSLHDQGVYAVANAYGSLAARLLFQPLEEAARLMFSKLGAEEEIEDSKAGGREVDRMKIALLLATLLKLVLMVGLVFVCFGFNYTELLLRILLMRRGGLGESTSTAAAVAASEVARVLSWYCIYVLFLAANGMCEAFVGAVARRNQVEGMGAGLVASFVAFWAVVGPLMSRFGTRGLVMANTVGMACRVLCSSYFIRRYFCRDTGRCTSQRTPGGATGVGGAKPLEGLIMGALPHPYVLGAMGLSFFVTGAFSSTGSGAEMDAWGTAGRHLGIGVVCLGCVGRVFLVCERDFVGDLASLWAKRKPGVACTGEGDGDRHGSRLSPGADEANCPVKSIHTKID